MSNLMNHVLMNKLDDELSEAIQSVGGDVSKAKGPWDYPEIIKAQLGVRSDSSLPSLDIKLGPGLKIEEINGVKYILATSGALTTCTLNPPTGSYLQPTSDVIEAGTPIQTVLESLFYEILPKMQSVYKGDIVIASNDGSDRYNEEDTRSGLIPNAHYMRLYVASRQEPIYVLLSGHGVVNNEIGNIPSQPSQPGTSQGYVGGTSQYIKVDVVGNVITASLNEEGAALFDKIITLEKTVEVHTNALNTVMNDVTDIKEALDLIGDVDLSGIGELNTKVNALDTKVNGMEAELAGKASQSDLDSIRESIESIDLSKVDELDSKVSSLESSVATIEDAISNIDLSSIDELKDKVDNIDTKVSEMESSIESKVSQEEFESFKESVGDVDFSEINSRLDNIDTKVSEMESSIESKVSQEEFESFKESVGDVDFSEINSRLDDVENSVTTLEDVVNNLDLSSVGELNTKLNEVSAKVTEIENSLESKVSKEDFEEYSEVVDSSLSSLNSSIAGIESSLGSKAEQSDIDDLQSSVNNIEEALGDIDLSKVGELENKVNEIESSLETKATQEELEEVQKTVTLVQETVVTRTEVETIVETQVQEVVSNDSFKEDVEQVIVQQITDTTNVEVQEAITQIIENVVATATVEETNSAVNDIFANK